MDQTRRANSAERYGLFSKKSRLHQHLGLIARHLGEDVDQEFMARGRTFCTHAQYRSASRFDFDLRQAKCLKVLVSGANIALPNGLPGHRIWVTTREGSAPAARDIKQLNALF